MPGQPVDELAVAEIKSAILTKLRLAIGKEAGMATRYDWYRAAALALRPPPEQVTGRGGVRPRQQLALAAILRQVREHLHEDLLRSVACVLAIAEHAERESVERAFQRVEQLFGCRAVAGNRRGCEVCECVHARVRDTSSRVSDRFFQPGTCCYS